MRAFQSEETDMVRGSHDFGAFGWTGRRGKLHQCLSHADSNAAPQKKTVGLTLLLGLSTMMIHLSNHSKFYCLVDNVYGSH